MYQKPFPINHRQSLRDTRRRVASVPDAISLCKPPRQESPRHLTDPQSRQGSKSFERLSPQCNFSCTLLCLYNEHRDLS